MGFIKIALPIVIILAVGINIFAFILEKTYKKKALKNSSDGIDNN